MSEVSVPDRAYRAMELWDRKLRAGKQLRRNSMVVQFAECLLGDKGVEGLAEFTGKTREMIENSTSITQRMQYSKFLLKVLEKRDDVEKASMELEVTNDDLFMTMMAGVIELIQTDPDFAKAVFQQAATTMLDTGQYNADQQFDLLREVLHAEAPLTFDSPVVTEVVE